MSRSAAFLRDYRLEDHPDNDPADDRDHGRSEQALARAEAELLRDPAADDRAEDADHDVREAAARGAAADDGTGQRAAQEPDANPAEEPEIEVHVAESGTSGLARKASIAATNSPAGGWCAAWGGPSTADAQTP